MDTTNKKEDSSSLIACEEEEDQDYLLPQTKYDPDEIRPKEVILIVLALLLLVCSVLLFFKHWKKNYRDINQLPYYAYLYQKDPAEFADVAPPAPPPIVPKVGKSCSDLAIGLPMGSSQPNLHGPPPLNRMSTDPRMPQLGGGGGRPRAPLLASRAASDVSFRYQRCRLDVMRRLKEDNEESFMLQNRRASEAFNGASSSSKAKVDTLKEEESPLEEKQSEEAEKRSCDKIDENNEITSSASISTDV